MRSPFSIFRKYQKIAMVIILLLIMVTFTIGDAVMKMSGNLPMVLIVVMTAMIGASIGALIGVQAGKPSEYAIAGVAVGVIVSLVAANLNGPAAAVETTAGNLSQKQLDDLVQQRLTANSFIVAVYQRVSPPPQDGNQFIREFWQGQLMRFQFSNGLYTPGNDSEESRARLNDDVVLGYLLNREADEMGIEVSDETVNTFIQSIRFGFSDSERRLSAEEFRDIRNRMHLSESHLYDALRAELRVRMALRNLTPDFMSTPDDYWKIYRQLHVRERLDVAAVPVDVMAKDIAEPDAAQIAAYFDEFKTVPPDYFGAGSPSFLQPRKVSLAYFEALFEDFKKEVGEVVDADVEKYYQDNKESYRNNPFPNGADTSKPGDNPLDPEFFPGGDGPSLTPETPKPGDAPKNPPASDKSEPAPAGDATKTPAAPEEPKADDQKSQPPETPKADPAPAPENKPEDKKDEKGARLERRSKLGNGELLALYQPPAETKADDAKPPETAAPDATPATDAAKTEAPKTDEPKADAAKTEPAAAETAAPPAAAAQPADAAAAPAKSETPGDAVTAPKPGEPSSEPEFRPLDDKLRTVIREQIVRQRTVARMKKAVDSAGDEMQKLRTKYITVDDKGNPGITEEEIAAKAKQIAEEHKLKYQAAGPLSEMQLRDADANPIGSTTDPFDAQIDPSSMRATSQKLFMSHSRQLFDPFVAESSLTSDRYAVWKTSDTEAHIPSLDEPGVKEQVITAWKDAQARPLAEKRASELAETVKTKKESMSKALAGQTVNGKPDGPALTTQLTESFSWLRESSAPQANLFQRPPPQISEVAALKNIDERFMGVVFDQMSEGDVRAIPNRDKSIYYVAQVYERKPSTKEDESAMLQAFLRDNIFGGFMGSTPYSYRMGMEQGRVRNQWVSELMRKYAVKWSDLEPKKATR